MSLKNDEINCGPENEPDANNINRQCTAYSCRQVNSKGRCFYFGCFGDLEFICCNLLNPLNAELNPICYLLALLAHHFLHVNRISVKSLTLRLLMSYIYMERLFLMFLDHTQRRSIVGRTPLDE